MNTIKECFNIILKGNKEESRQAARRVRKLLYSAQDVKNKYRDIINITNKAPHEYRKVAEEWRQENFVMAISVVYFLHDKKIESNFLFPWIFQLLQYRNGNIRYAAVRMLESDLGPLTFHLRCPEYEHDKLKSEQAEKILYDLFTS